MRNPPVTDAAVLTDEDRAEAASFAAAAGADAEVVGALVEREVASDHLAYLAAIRRFSERYLPSRGWSRVLQAGAGAGSGAILLAERGYDVTVLDADDLRLRFAQHLLERRGLEAAFLHADPAEITRESYDAIFCFDASDVASDAVRAAEALRSSVRTGGFLFGGPAFADAIVERYRELKRLGLKAADNFGPGVAPLRRRGRIGRLAAAARIPL